MTVRWLHFIWGGPPIPDRFRENLKAWASLHPDWDLTLWGDDDLTWLEHRDLFDAASDLVPADAVWQLRSDIARYEILRKHGGFYADTDCRPLRPIDDAIAGHDAWAAMESKRFTGNTYLYFEPEHPLICWIVDGMRTSIETNRGRRPNRMTGPKYLTPLWLEFGAYTAPSREWFPISWSQARRGVSIENVPGSPYAVHEFSHVRELMAGRR